MHEEGETKREDDYLSLKPNFILYITQYVLQVFYTNSLGMQLSHKLKKTTNNSFPFQKIKSCSATPLVIFKWSIQHPLSVCIFRDFIQSFCLEAQTCDTSTKCPSQTQWPSLLSQLLDLFVSSTCSNWNFKSNSLFFNHNDSSSHIQLRSCSLPYSLLPPSTLVVDSFSHVSSLNCNQNYYF